jgi:hypothetical protein
MAKARKTTARKPAKRVAKKRKTVRLKGRKPARAKRAKARKPTSFVEAVKEAVALRDRLSGHNTFED